MRFQIMIEMDCMGLQLSHGILIKIWRFVVLSYQHEKAELISKQNSFQRNLFSLSALFKTLARENFSFNQKVYLSCEVTTATSLL